MLENYAVFYLIYILYNFNVTNKEGISSVSNSFNVLLVCACNLCRGHGGRVVTVSPPTSEAGIRFLAWPQVGKLVVACCWSAVYSTEP